jgi:outer membrane protein OmpA-like peptidoglycan-associated protein
MITAAAPLGAQLIPANEVGIYGAYQLVQHDANIAGIPGCPTCSPGFTGGDGGGFAVGALYRLGFAPRFGLDLRLGYAYFGGGLSTEENIGNVMSGGETVDAMVEHTIDVSLGMLMFEPRVTYAAFSFPLVFDAGVQVGFFNAGSEGGDPMFPAEFHQSERLISPAGVTFIDGSTTRNDTTGRFPGGSRMLLGAIIGARYDIPIGSRFTVSPEVEYHYSFGSLLEGETWKAHALRLGASFTYRLGRDPGQPEELPNLPLAATVAASGLYADGSEQPIVQVRVEEFLGPQLRPLLNYVFFDQGSSALPARYNRLSRVIARAFTLANVHGTSTLDMYHHMLNIVGRRMLEAPQSQIRLVGTNDGDAENGNRDLSRKRAESVRDYLRDVWGIAPERMKIETRDLPEKPSNGETRDGDEENRRVEIIPDNAKILEPVLTMDTTRTADPPAVRFRTSARADAGLASWRLIASQSGRTVKEIGGSGQVPPTVDWNFEQTSMPSIPVPIDYTLEVTDANGQRYSTPIASIPTNQITIQKKRRERTADKEISRYSLILFDFDKAEITGLNRRIVDMIRNRITLAADVAITGYADRVGDAQHNAQLAMRRAEATAEALGTAKTTVKGVGESNKHDNNLPEGRFYCRTVEVVVTTPIDE